MGCLVASLAFCALAFVWSCIACCMCCCKSCLTPPLPIFAGCACILDIIGVTLYGVKSGQSLGTMPITVQSWQDLERNGDFGYSMWIGIAAIGVLFVDTLIGIIIIKTSKITPLWKFIGAICDLYLKNPYPVTSTYFYRTTCINCVSKCLHTSSVQFIAHFTIVRELCVLVLFFFVFEVYIHLPTKCFFVMRIKFSRLLSRMEKDTLYHCLTTILIVCLKWASFKMKLVKWW